VICVICRRGAETDLGRTTVTLERRQTVLVIRGVPAQVCRNCGEAYVDETVTADLLKVAEEAVRTGIQVDVREYMAA
jgi:YgiT-type zinc finger domain-containing protein